MDLSGIGRDDHISSMTINATFFDTIWHLLIPLHVHLFRLLDFPLPLLHIQPCRPPPAPCLPQCVQTGPLQFGVDDTVDAHRPAGAMVKHVVAVPEEME